MQNKILFAILIVIVAAGAFFAGVKYQQTKVASRQLQFAGAGGQGGYGRRFGGAGGNFQSARGQVVTMDTSSITLKLSDGSTKLINLSGNTKFVKSDQASASDVKSGSMIMVIGTQNSDGSLSAQNVQVNPMNRMMR